MTAVSSSTPGPMAGPGKVRRSYSGSAAPAVSRSTTSRSLSWSHTWLSPCRSPCTSTAGPGEGEHGVGPVAPVHDDLALPGPGQRREPLAQGRGRGWRQVRTGELADGGLGTLARHWVVQRGQEPRELPAGPLAVDRVDDLEQRCPRAQPRDPDHP